MDELNKRLTKSTRIQDSCKTSVPIEKINRILGDS